MADQKRSDISQWVTAVDKTTRQALISYAEVAIGVQRTLLDNFEGLVNKLKEIEKRNP